MTDRDRVRNVCIAAGIAATAILALTLQSEP